MFNLLVKGNGWFEGRDSLHLSRVLEYTSPSICKLLRPNNELNLENLIKYPAIFLEETTLTDKAQIVRVGKITSAKIISNEILIEYVFDARAKLLTNEYLESLARDLDIEPYEFTRTHWSVKDVDLFKVLFLNQVSSRISPKIFKIDEIENINPKLVSVMMPFDEKYSPVYKKIGMLCDSMGLTCKRADDIWVHSELMQDIVSLIDQSMVVIADCTSRNPNVFYEIGIAHTLSKEVLLITQSIDDIPFDLNYLRAVKYYPNSEGLEVLINALKLKFNQIFI